MNNKQTLVGTRFYERSLSFPLYLSNKAKFSEKKKNSSSIVSNEYVRRLHLIDSYSSQAFQSENKEVFAKLMVQLFNELFGESNCMIAIFSNDMERLEILYSEGYHLPEREVLFNKGGLFPFCNHLQQLDELSWHFPTIDSNCAFAASFQGMNNLPSGILICDYSTIWSDTQEEFSFFSNVMERVSTIWKQLQKNWMQEEKIVSLSRQKELLEQDAEELQKQSAAIEQFTYELTHDFKAPIRNIGGFTSLLKKKYQSQLDETANTYLDNIMMGVKRFSKTINRLLHYSSVNKEDEHFHIIDLEELLNALLSNLAMLIKEREATILWEALPNKVLGDADQIEQLFQNLILNAIKFTPADRNPLIKIEVNYLPDEYIFCINDNGIGIDSNQQTSIFQPFKRLHARTEFEGSGIGLSICQKIVERHNGRIWVQSEGKGKGSSFYFTIPRSEEE